METKKTKTILYQCGTEVPEPKGYINDFVGFFSAEQVNALDSLAREHEKTTTNQVSVITVDSAMLGNCTPKDYGDAVGNSWGVGQKDKNNGVLIVLAPALRTVSISNGKGIAPKMSDEETALVIKEIMIPEFKKGDFYTGIRKGMLAIMAKIR